MAQRFCEMISENSKIPCKRRQLRFVEIADRQTYLDNVLQGLFFPLVPRVYLNRLTPRQPRFRSLSARISRWPLTNPALPLRKFSTELFVNNNDIN